MPSIPFVRQGGLLRCYQALPSRVSEETIQASGRVANMEAHGRGAQRLSPELLVGKDLDGAPHVFYRLKESMSYGLQEPRDFGDRAAEPRFGRMVGNHTLIVAPFVVAPPQKIPRRPRRLEANDRSRTARILCSAIIEPYNKQSPRRTS